MKIYTDGSCSGVIGGWAWVNQMTGESASGAMQPTTNQRMELYAALDAVDTFLDDPHLVIISDSKYLVRCFNDKWYEKWVAFGWRTRTGEHVANQDIWKPLLALVQENGNVRFEWIKGHSGDVWNDWADQLAQDARIKAEARYLKESTAWR
jgi:ribonuclease HI